MEINAIGSIDSTIQNSSNGIKPGSGFEVWLESNLDSVNSKLIEADNKIQDYAVGESNSIHEVMLAVESAKLEFQLVLEMRNKILEGYQELSRMQI